MRAQHVVAGPLDCDGQLAERGVRMGERRLSGGTGERVLGRCQACLEGRGNAGALEGSGNDIVSGSQA